MPQAKMRSATAEQIASGSFRPHLEVLPGQKREGRSIRYTDVYGIYIDGGRKTSANTSLSDTVHGELASQILLRSNVKCHMFDTFFLSCCILHAGIV